MEQNENTEEVLSEKLFDEIVPFNTAKIQESIKNSRFYSVEEYDELCEEHSRIQSILPLKHSCIKLTFRVILDILTACILELLMVWFPKLNHIFSYSKVGISEANFLEVEGNDKESYIVPINRVQLPQIPNSFLLTEYKSNLRTGNILTYFIFKQFKYIYLPLSDTFTAMKFEMNTTYHKIHTVCTQGLTNNEVQYQKFIHGECQLNIQVDSFVKILILEFTDPFYIFQVASIILWMSNDYIAYASMIIIATLVSLLVGTYETRQNLKSIQQMAKYQCNVNIYRRNIEGKYNIIQTSSTELVPGDLFEVQNEGLAMPCDCILIKGTVIINESMLTGESTPIIKAQIPDINNEFSLENEKKKFLFAGTTVIQKRTLENEKVLAIVYSTGFNTAKGNLIRSILFPKEVNFKFKNDSVKYIKLMACLSFIGFGISLPFLISVAHLNAYSIVEKMLDLITTTVPPALPACVGIGISYALKRLKKGSIICIDRDRVNVSGKVNMICFDKTGTLTEDHLDIFGFVPVKVNKDLFLFSNFSNTAKEFSEKAFDHYKKKRNAIEKDKNKDLNLFFVECLASCHCATYVEGNLIGDPIDVKMFQSCDWELIEASNDIKEVNTTSLISTYVRPIKETPLNEKIANLKEEEDEDQIIKEHYELGIVRRFDFSSKLQRMSVIVKDVNDGHYKVYCKGSPEKIKELCRPETIPDNFNEQLNKYTSKGLRVLAMSIKMVKMNYMQSQQITREKCEKDMIFLGLLLVQNRLKEMTKPSIKKLEEAKIRMVMATGDNILTAISVSKECELIKSNAVVYSCEVKNNELVWTTVENFQELKDEIHLLSNVVFENADITTNSRSFTAYIPPESFTQRVSRPSALFPPHVLAEQKIKEKENALVPPVEEIMSINLELDESPIKGGMEEDNIIAITGSTFETLCRLKDKYLETKLDKYKDYYDVFRVILRDGYIFARMAPEHKTLLVENLRKENLTVLMCGDGANDCGALRAADIGVSLSPEEASIAAHFTSNIPDISCIIKLLREGKASLVTSIQTFKFMMMYSLIQFFSVTILMVKGSYLADYQFLATDLFIIFPLEFSLGITGAYSELTYHRPTDSLISFPIISSILIQSAINLFFQIGAWAYMSYGTTWYNNECKYDNNDNPQSCHSNTVIYLVANMQYLTAAFAFSISKPFRQPIYSNVLLTAFLILAFVYSMYIIVYPDKYSINFLNLENLKEEHQVFLLIILGITIVNFVCCYLTESFLIPALMKCYNKRQMKKLEELGKKGNYEYNLNQINYLKNKIL